MGLGLNHALYLDLPDKVAKERIKKRAAKIRRDKSKSPRCPHSRNLGIQCFFSSCRIVECFKRGIASLVWCEAEFKFGY